MKFRKARSSAGVVLGAAALAFGTMAMPAQAATSAHAAAPAEVGITALPSWCTPPVGELWNEDGRTIGVRCDVTFAYYARVSCTNGSTTKVARGATASYNSWSYAYCTSFGSNYRVISSTATAVRA